MPIEWVTATDDISAVCDCGDCQRMRTELPPTRRAYRAGPTTETARYIDVINKLNIPCPSCQVGIAKAGNQLDTSEDLISAKMMCESCDFLFDKTLPRAILDSIVNEQQRINEQQGESMSQVHLVCRGRGRDLHVVEVFTRLIAAEAVAVGHIDSYTQSFDVVTPDAEFFDVFIVSVGKDDNYRIAGVTANKRTAKKLASSVGGTIQVREAVPSRRQRREVNLYRHYVIISSSLENSRQGGRYQFIKLFAGEQPAYKVTRRRRYNSDLPYRLEVIGPNDRKVEQLTDWLIYNESKESIAENFEYNVDYTYVEIQRGQWERELKSPVLVEA